jgi:antitoxin VapB
MALSIKDEETDRLARQVAQLNGETVTMAVKVALKERLERQKPNPKAGLAEWLDELTKRTCRHPTKSATCFLIRRQDCHYDR